MLTLPQIPAPVLLGSSKPIGCPKIWSSAPARCNRTNWVGAYKDGWLCFQTRASGSDSPLRGCALVRYSYIRYNIFGKLQIFLPIFQRFSINVSESQPEGHGLTPTSISPISFSVRLVLEAASWGGPEERQGVG